MMALNTSRLLGINYDSLSRSVERLSSGMRINKASDDAAGLAVRELMRSDIAGLGQAERNVQDGISFAQTMEGALDEINNILVRIKELAEQAATGSYSSSQRSIMNNESNQLIEEAKRILNNTKFNDISAFGRDDIGIHVNESVITIDALNMNDMAMPYMSVQSDTGVSNSASETFLTITDSGSGGGGAAAVLIDIQFSGEEAYTVEFEGAGTFTLDDIVDGINNTTNFPLNSNPYIMAQASTGSDGNIYLTLTAANGSSTNVAITGVTSGGKDGGGTNVEANLEGMELHSFMVDPSLQRLHLTVVYNGRIEDIGLLLMDSAAEYYSASNVDENQLDEGYQTTVLYKVDSPKTGYWDLIAVPSDPDNLIELDYTIEGLFAPGQTYTLNVVTESGSNRINYPQPVIFNADLRMTRKIIHANVNYVITGPDGFVQSGLMQDNGTGADKTADDGLYTAVLSEYDRDGLYEIRINADNKNGNAFLTYNGLMMSVPYDPYEDPTPPDVLLINDFNRSSFMQVHISGYRQDDFSNNLADAFDLTLDNTPVDGKCEQPGDVDAFSIHAADDGDYVIRLIDMQEGFEGRLNFYDSTSRPLSENITRLDRGAEGQYPAYRIHLQNTEPVYITIKGQEDTTGYYKISAGPEIASDDQNTCTDCATVEDYTGLDIQNAISLIETIGLNPGSIITGYSDTAPDGQVIRQSIKPSTCVPCGNTIDLVVSSGYGLKDFSGAWLSSSSIFDIAPENGDGIVDLMDFAVFSEIYRFE